MASRLDSGLEASTQSLPTSKDETRDDGESVRVFLRVRPSTERELAIASPQVVFVDGPSVTVKSDPPRSFTFDGVLGESSTQQEVFESVGRAVGSSCLAGYNGSVYVYGQTGAGKTHTMCGPINSVQSMQFDERRGIICRMLDFIFSEVARRGAEGTSSVEHRCRCSFLEIYKEQVTDLLEPQNANLQVREDLTRGIYVERLSEVAVSSLAEAFQVLWRGLRQRQVGSTHMNDKSSRSHAVFTLYVEAHEKRAGVTSTRVASLNLIDLAGSERQQHAGDPRSSLAQYANTKESLRVKEAGAINKSLSALTNVIMSLSREDRLRRERRGERPRNNYVHYRDSKLTFLLRDSLGGNSKTVIVANCSPAQICVQETISTLKFAARAKHIRCSVVRNEAFSGTVESLMEEVKFMRKKLANLSGHSFDKSTLLAEPGTIEEPEAEDSGEDLDTQQQVARLEVLLSAALEREQQADQRQHRLHRLAKFLEDLDFRKCSGWRQLYNEYASHLQQASAITDDEEVQELSSKLVGFAALLGNLVQGARLEDGEDMTESTGSTEAPPQLEDMGNEEISGDEAAFIREENRLLRRQLEDHPEVHRLRAENWALREELRALDPGWPRIPSGEGAAGENSSKVLSPPAVSAEALLRGLEDDDTSSKTWFYFQKMAKEVEELTRAKEKLIYAMEVAEQTGPNRTQDFSSRRFEEADEQDGSSVRVAQVIELDIATREALKQAQELLRPGRLGQGRRGAKEVDEGSAGLAVKEEAAPANEEDRLKQAFLRIKQLQGTVDLVNAAYGDAFDEFQSLREDYESRWEECQFFELQCSRLNLACLDLADRLTPGQRPRPGFSTTGFWPTATEKQKRSFSMTSLRDASFWEQRFQELQELTGAVVEDQPPSGRKLSGASEGLPTGDLAQSNSMSALTMRSHTPPLGTTATPMRRVFSAPVLVAPHVAAVPAAPMTSVTANHVATPWMPVAGPSALAMPQPSVPKLALGSMSAEPPSVLWKEGRRASSVGRKAVGPTVPMSRLSDGGHAQGPISQRASLPARVPLQVPVVPATAPGHRWQAPKQVPHLRRI